MLQRVAAIEADLAKLLKCNKLITSSSSLTSHYSGDESYSALENVGCVTKIKS